MTTNETMERAIEATDVGEVMFYATVAGRKQIVRAVLSAIRTPDAGMIEAAWKASYPEKSDVSARFKELVAEDFTIQWQAAINQLLREPK